MVRVAAPPPPLVTLPEPESERMVLLAPFNESWPLTVKSELGESAVVERALRTPVEVMTVPAE